ncbi:lipopolysaccharide biosynthesis protein [Arundinibacter roseus]|uniref:lipopolysaccharide biosynthesis protein n=1 Tax=Arundinibacter roseus TaxID=2070510 RepID=UPI0018FE1D3D|nr:hypothetical protein [Arundinibacter roseus]
MKENSKLIAKNTILLYFRMIVTMAVTLYMSRIILNILGVEDFGVYSVVGGIVLVLSFLNSSMSSATQRFLSFELGKKDYKKLQIVFSVAVKIHILIAMVIMILAETIGLWFLNFKMVIPIGRLESANWVYQFSVLSFLISVISVPYNASIIAHERMTIFAYISILEVLLKLISVFILDIFQFDKLKLYAIFIFLITIIIRGIYKVYCKRMIPACTYINVQDKQLFKKLLNYASWNLWGNFAGVMLGQGINILLNLFFGPNVNAARGISYQISAALNQLVVNFQMAVNPQIIKSYADDNKYFMHKLIQKSAKLSFFLIFLLAVPTLIYTEYILNLWIQVVPRHTVIFTRLVIIITTIDCISGPLMTAAQASGKIKKYQSIVGGLLILTLPISYLFLKLGYPPEITMYINIAISIITLFVRLAIIAPLVNLSIFNFFREVLWPILNVTLILFVFSIYQFKLFSINTTPELIFGVFINFFSTALVILIFGLRSDERRTIIHILNNSKFSVYAKKKYQTSIYRSMK